MNFRKEVTQCKKNPTIPNKYLNKLELILNELEQEMNNLYEITIREKGCNESVTIKPFNKRNKYIISKMKSEYKELEGEYDSLIDINKKIARLKYGNLLIGDLSTYNNSEIIKGDWRCRECGYNKNYVGNELCQANCQTKNKCDYRHQSIWHNISINLIGQEVYTSGGGSLSICHPLGRIDCVN